MTDEIRHERMRLPLHFDLHLHAMKHEGARQFLYVMRCAEYNLVVQGNSVEEALEEMATHIRQTKYLAEIFPETAAPWLCHEAPFGEDG